MLFYSLAILMLVTFCFIIWVVVEKCLLKHKQEDFRTRTKLKFKGAMMRVILEFYVPVFISVFFNVQHMDLTEAFDYLSLIFAAAFSLNMLVIPVYYAIILHKYRKHLEDPDTIRSYGVLYQRLKTTSMTTLLTYQILLLRRFLMVLVLCFLVFSVHLQISLLILISGYAVPHMLIVRPFKELKDNITTTLSDVAFTIAGIQLPFLAMKRNEAMAGDILIFTLITATVLNGVICFVFFIPTIVELYRKYCKKKTNKIDIEII